MVLLFAGLNSSAASEVEREADVVSDRESEAKEKGMRGIDQTWVISCQA